MDSTEEEYQISTELQNIDQDLKQVNRAIQKLEDKKRRLEIRREELNVKLDHLQVSKAPSVNWETSDYSWSEEVFQVLKTVFKITKFRPYQLSAINAVLSKEDCILLMPTGGGKSLCYQLPALVMDGMTLVVSPLVSLMEDQLMALEALNIPATALTGSSSKELVNSTHKAMTESRAALKLLYVTPEKLAKNKSFMSKLEKSYEMGRLSLIAIDEVHCCSQWGHDFRPDYKFLGIMKRQFPRVPILGLTATATTKVIADVQKILNIQNCLVLRASFNRANLKYEVHSKADSQKESIEQIEDLLKNRFKGLSGIIYCFSIRESEEIAAELWKRGLKVQSYHAQLNAKERSLVHKRWVENKLQAVVATIAFGMGIDKPDVRFVIHHSMAKSMENYYQESGRAGRDDQPAHCILLYRFADIFRQSTMVFTEQTGLENLYSMVAYCLELTRCRRKVIADHFGEKWQPSDCKAMCDRCDNTSHYSVQERDVTKHCLSLFSILEHCARISERLTAAKVIEAWLGKGPAKLRPPGHNGTLLSKTKCERLIAFMLLEGYLKEEFHFTPYSTISYIAKGPRTSSVIAGKGTIVVPLPMLKPELPEKETASSSSSPPLPTAKKMRTEAAKDVKNKPVDRTDKSLACFVNSKKSHFKNANSAGNSSVQNHTKSGLKTADDIDFDEDSTDADFAKIELNTVSSSSQNTVDPGNCNSQPAVDSHGYESSDGIEVIKPVSPNKTKRVPVLTVSDDDDDLDFGEVTIKPKLSSKKKKKKKKQDVTYIDSD